jgi:lysophospholipase L1-like esterase
MKLNSLVPTRLSRSAFAALCLIGTAAAALTLFAPGARMARAGIDRCGAPPELTALAAPLPHTARRLAEGRDLTIVALGSSSTYGTGSSSPDKSYPSRLASLLQARFPGATIRVLNRGNGGELGTATAERIERDVLPERPDLVIWQFGTNDVLRDLDPAAASETLRAGIERLQAAGADVILMDLQYAPRVLAHPSYREMERALWAAAHATDVSVFPRFAIMRHWAEDGYMTLPVMLANDHLHMTDASYDCLARQLNASILRDARPVLATDS